MLVSECCQTEVLDVISAVYAQISTLLISALEGAIPTQLCMSAAKAIFAMKTCHLVCIV